MKILVCPLSWGLGHATRCVPIIQHLLDTKNEVIIASDAYALAFLRQEFPALHYEILPSYNIRYSAGKTQIWAMLCSLPKIVFAAWCEHRWLKKYLKKNADTQKVISDNRFGMWNKNVESVYITHQLMIKMPAKIKFLETFVHRLHLNLIKHYDKCLIPDLAGENNLSGDLAHKFPLPPNAEFIGILSRFSASPRPKGEGTGVRYDTVCIISGIEPQRTIFENELIQRFSKSEEKILIVRGLPENETKTQQIGNITLVSHVGAKNLLPLLTGAKKIISRSGYSSIMDYAALDCLEKVEFHPTRGQTEQEYLAEYHTQKSHYRFVEKTPSKKDLRIWSSL